MNGEGAVERLLGGVFGVVVALALLGCLLLLFRAYAGIVLVGCIGGAGWQLWRAQAKRGTGRMSNTRSIEKLMRCLTPRIEDLNASRLEVGGVARHDCHAMHKRGSGNKGVAFGARVWHMQLGATLRDGGINRKYAPFKSGQYLVVNPRAQNQPLRLVFSLYRQCAEFKLQHGDDRNENAGEWHGRSPCHHFLICFFRTTKLGNNVGVEHKHQDKSGVRKILPACGAVKSKSGTFGCANASTSVI